MLQNLSSYKLPPTDIVQCTVSARQASAEVTSRTHSTTTGWLMSQTRITAVAWVTSLNTNHHWLVDVIGRVAPPTGWLHIFSVALQNDRSQISKGKRRQHTYVHGTGSLSQSEQRTSNRRRQSVIGLRNKLSSYLQITTAAAAARYLTFTSNKLPSLSI